MPVDSAEAIKRVALTELQEGANGPQTIASRFNMEHRKDAVVHGDEDAKLTEEEALVILEQMAREGLVVRLDDPEGWFQLADWDDRPLRVLAVSQHITKIDGASQMDVLWLDESLRAARYEHDRAEEELRALPPEDDRSMYVVCTAGYEVLEEYRETLTRLARETRGSNEEKSLMYERLADATALDGPMDRREREVGLRG